MCQPKKCPECGEYTVYYDAYFKAYCCSRFACTYFGRVDVRETATSAPVGSIHRRSTIHAIPAR